MFDVIAEGVVLANGVSLAVAERVCCAEKDLEPKIQWHRDALEIEYFAQMDAWHKETAKNNKKSPGRLLKV